MFVKPLGGAKIRIPLSRSWLPEQGMNVPDGDSYWLRRAYRDGAVEIVIDPQPKAKVDKTEKKDK